MTIIKSVQNTMSSNCILPSNSLVIKLFTVTKTVAAVNSIRNCHSTSQKLNFGLSINETTMNRSLVVNQSKVRCCTTTLFFRSISKMGQFYSYHFTKILRFETTPLNPNPFKPFNFNNASLHTFDLSFYVWQKLLVPSVLQFAQLLVDFSPG